MSRKAPKVQIPDFPRPPRVVVEMVTTEPYDHFCHHSAIPPSSSHDSLKRTNQSMKFSILTQSCPEGVKCGQLGCIECMTPIHIAELLPRFNELHELPEKGLSSFFSIVNSPLRNISRTYVLAEVERLFGISGTGDLRSILTQIYRRYVDRNGAHRPTIVDIPLHLTEKALLTFCVMCATTEHSRELETRVIDVMKTLLVFV